MLIEIAGFSSESIVDGEGIRFTLFTQGCHHNCRGCHNPQTHEEGDGQIMTTEDVLYLIEDSKLVDGLTLSGGEPFNQWEACYEIASAVKDMGKTVWCYSGYIYEELEGNPLLEVIDVLVDGRFVKDLKTAEIPFVGSSNQRVIDVQESLRQDKVILYKG